MGDRVREIPQTLRSIAPHLPRAFASLFGTVSLHDSRVQRPSVPSWPSLNQTSAGRIARRSFRSSASTRNSILIYVDLRDRTVQTHPVDSANLQRAQCCLAL